MNRASSQTKRSSRLQPDLAPSAALPGAEAGPTARLRPGKVKRASVPGPALGTEQRRNAGEMRQAWAPSHIGEPMLPCKHCDLEPFPPPIKRRFLKPTLWVVGRLNCYDITNALTTDIGIQYILIFSPSRGVLTKMLLSNEEFVKKETETQSNLLNSCLSVSPSLLIHYTEFSLFI